MYIRTRQVYLDKNGNILAGCQVFIGQPNTNPREEVNQLELFNGINGEALSNPFFTDGNGRARGINNEKADPFIVEEEYSIEFRGPNGNLIDRIPHFVSDAFGASGGGGTADAIVDVIVDNFAAALSTDLTGNDTAYIRSYAAGWQGTGAGPVGDFLVYRTGSSGTPSTGNPGAFFDLGGNEWKPMDSQRLYAEMFGAVSGAGNDSFQGIQDMLNAAFSLNKPCYLDGEDYFVNTQANTAPSYSVINTYALALPEEIAIHGSGNTTISNTSPDAGQFLFFGENVNKLTMDGLILDGNSVISDSGALYLAGVLDADLDLIINNSATTYLSASTTRQSGDIRFNFQFENTVGYALSGKSGGYKTATGNIVYINCAQGFEVSREDSDGFSLIFVEPRTTVNSSLGDVAQEVFNVHNGAFEYGSINVNANTAIICTLDADDIEVIQGGAITGCDEVFECVATGVGILQNCYIDSAIALNITTFGVSIDSNVQLVKTFVIKYAEFDGSGTGLICGDDTQLGVIRFEGGSFNTLTNGIVINQTNGQKLITKNLDLSGVTNEINDSDKSDVTLSGNEYFGSVQNEDATATWIGIQLLDWELTSISGASRRVRVTHNLGNLDYYVSAITIDDTSSASRDAHVYDKDVNYFEILISNPTDDTGINKNFDFIVRSNW